ncbi:MAG TPA: hypothetical protein VK776_02650 [Bryobacteraceae bacterium]|nr:hypothetical protein [Bryobacteraceae bacterium]
MDAFKLAFETVIVGLFALPWLWVMIDLVNPNFFNSFGMRRLSAFIPSELRASAIGLSLFSLVYLLGSMMTPVAREFFNDPDMLGRVLPTDKKIQAQNYKKIREVTTSGLLARAKLGLVHAPETKAIVDDMSAKFQQDESTVLLRGPDACERLNRLHEQMTVLRGAAFSAFALMVLCGFAWCGRFSNQPTVIGWSLFLGQQSRRLAALTLSSAIILVAGWGLWKDMSKLATGNMPIAELVLLILGGFGFYVLIWGTRSRLRFHGSAFVFALCFSLLCYTGYGCTERSYDLEVLYSYQALVPATDGDSVHGVARPVASASFSE